LSSLKTGKQTEDKTYDFIGHRHPVYTIADQFLEKVGHGVYKIYKPPSEEKPKKRRRYTK
jgi:hypothetical protein